MKSFVCLAAVAAALTACNPEGLSGPAAPDAPTQRNVRGAGAVTVLSRNLYVGTDVDGVILALATPDPFDDFPALLGAIQILQQTDFPTRARAFAEEIARDRPHVVGLQEVSDLGIDLRALGLPINIQLDFLPILLAELGARGLNYQAAAVVQNFTAAPLPGISLTDSDVMLVDADRVVVTPGSIRGTTFALNLGPVAPGVTLARGWVALEGTVDGWTHTFISTHLESGGQPGLDLLRAGQIQEIVAATNAASRVILMGDLNDQPGSPMYQALVGAGFADAWATLRPGGAGNTCCHAADLSNPVADMTQRIDYVFTRGEGHPIAGLEGRIDLIGLGPQDRLGKPGPLWASDHAGIVARVLSPVAKGASTF